jgi:ATP-dependent DNA helicase RecQ
VVGSINQRASELLGVLTGREDASFRPDQLDAIGLLVEERARVLLVQRTGWGKSAVYFIATKLLRDDGAGPTLLVSPLLALMRNQIEAAERMGVRAATINSDNRDAWSEVAAAIENDEVDILLISAERLANPGFRREVMPLVGRRSGLLVVDEAHCISDWGHDFRPDYRRITRVVDLVPSNVPVLCCTATANDRVVDDVRAQLGDGLRTVRGTLARDGLQLHALRIPSPAQRMAWLATVVPDLPGSGIVYCLTVRDAEIVARWLQTNGIAAAAYHGASEGRTDVEQQLLGNEVKVVVATSALGMGFDKPDLAFVIHFQTPGSPVAYYQQVGRAGRQLSSSLGICLSGTEDTDIQDFFIDTAFPAAHLAEQVVALLEAQDQPIGITAIEAQVNIKHSRLELLLKLLEVDGAVTRVDSGKDKGKYVRTASPWAYDTERVDRVTALRRHEQQQMRDYVAADTCRMELLRGWLDDPLSEPCGACDTCTGRRFPTEVDTALAARAQAFVRNRPIVIEPRKQWPSGLPTGMAKLSTLRLEPGRALCSWADGGWGRAVRDGRNRDDHFGDDLVDASAALIASWRPEPAIEWITYVPSRRRPMLVPDFAERLGGCLELPVVPCVTKVRDTEPQKQMENSAQQAANVLDAFEITGPLPSGPVLLVDAVYDSRWTLTVVGAALRTAGAPQVYPFALAVAQGD